MAIIEANLEVRIVECNEMATMAQARSREESKAMKMAYNKAATMEDEINKKIGSAKCEL